MTPAATQKEQPPPCPIKEPFLPSGNSHLAGGARAGHCGWMRRIVRKVVTAVASLLAIVVLYPVISEFFIELAREKGWYQHPSQRLGDAMTAFNAFVSQPWFTHLAAIFGGLALGMWADTALRRRRIEHSLIAPQPEYPDAPSEEPDEIISPEYIKLSKFFNEQLLPLSDALLAFRADILKYGIDNVMARSMAAHGLTQPTFFGSLDPVTDKLGCSPVQYPSYHELSVAIHNAEFNYQDCLDDTQGMADAFGLNPSTDSRLHQVWEGWLATAYKDIKLDPTLRGLYRPRRESKWGAIVPPA
jgi:hypothetical protein